MVQTKFDSGTKSGKIWSVPSNVYGEKLLNRCVGVNSHVGKPVEAAGLTELGQ